MLQIFEDISPLNHRPDIDDVILLVTDGEPRGSRNTKADTLAEAEYLKAKGVRIIGVRLAHYPVHSDFIKNVSTDDQSIETTFDDIGNTVDRIVLGFCPQLTSGVMALFSLL